MVYQLKALCFSLLSALPSLHQDVQPGFSVGSQEGNQVPSLPGRLFSGCRVGSSPSASWRATLLAVSGPGDYQLREVRPWADQRGLSISRWWWTPSERGSSRQTLGLSDSRILWIISFSFRQHPWRCGSSCWATWHLWSALFPSASLGCTIFSGSWSPTGLKLWTIIWCSSPDCVESLRWSRGELGVWNPTPNAPSFSPSVYQHVNDWLGRPSSQSDNHRGVVVWEENLYINVLEMKTRSAGLKRLFQQAGRRVSCADARQRRRRGVSS